MTEAEPWGWASPLCPHQIQAGGRAKAEATQTRAQPCNPGPAGHSSSPEQGDS